MTENAAWTIPSSASKVSDLTKLSRAIPTPGPGQVLVKLTAASLNFRDLLIATRSPDYPGLHKDDLVSGSDGAGIIWSAGPFSKWLGREKTKVMVHNCSWITGDSRNWDFDKVLGGVVTDGTLQQYIVMDDELVIVAPSNLSTVETASLSTAGVTAWGAIRASLDMGLDGALEKWPTSTSLSFLEGNSPATPVTTNTTWTAKRLTGLTVLTMGTGGVSCFAIQVWLSSAVIHV
jgi:NADPH:quinone reductase-like Zn-dependent oxidoreductase